MIKIKSIFHEQCTVIITVHGPFRFAGVPHLTKDPQSFRNRTPSRPILYRAD